MIGFGAYSRGELPELAAVFRLERNGLGNSNSNNDNGNRQSNEGNIGDANSQGTDKHHHENNNSGFEYRAATEFLRKQPEQVQYVLYKGRRAKEKHLLHPLGSNKILTENNENTQDYKCSSKGGRFLYSPLQWACIETTQEEEAIEFLRTIRDIDPTLFLLQDDQGALPIEGECILNASIPMIRFLLEIYLDHDFVCPNGPKMTEDNFNALTCLCGSCWWEDIEQAHQEIVSGRRIVKGTNVLEDNLGIDDHFWALIFLLTKAFYHKTIDEVREPKEEELPNAKNSSSHGNSNSNTTQLLHISNEHGERTIQFRLLHACAGIDWFPPNLLRLLVAAFPQALLDRDEDGNLPIHVAASGVFSSYKIDATWDGDFEANSGYQKTTIDIYLEANPELASILDGEGKLPLQLALESEHCRPWEDGGIRSILEAYPEAAKIRSLAKGKLPLVIALENHRDWNNGTAALLEAYPGAAGLYNPSNSKFPLELAIEKEIHFDEGVYGLLEASPAVVIQERERCFGGETDDQRRTSSSSTTRKIHNDLPIFAQAAAEDCSISVIYKLLRMWPQSCKVETCNKKQPEAIAPRSCGQPPEKRQKTL